MKKTILFTTLLLVLAQLAYAGVTNPLPTELNLFKGESGRFKFQVQTIQSNQALECTSSLEGTSPLTVEFDPPVITIPAGTVKDIYGTVTVPRDIDFGTYEENFCLVCKPAEGVSGAAVQIETCDLPIKVNVVTKEQRDAGKENMYVPPKPVSLAKQIIFVVAILLFIAIVAFAVWKRLKKTKKKKKKKTAKKKAKKVTKKRKKKR